MLAISLRPHHSSASVFFDALLKVHLSHNCIIAASVPQLLRAFAEHNAYPRRYDEDCFASWVPDRGPNSSASALAVWELIKREDAFRVHDC